MAADPESTLVVYTTDQDGVDYTADFTQVHYGDLGIGSKFSNDGKVILLLRTAGARTVTIVGQRKSAYGILSDSVYVAGAGVHVLGPFSTDHFNDSTGYTHITFNGTASTDMILAIRRGNTRD